MALAPGAAPNPLPVNLEAQSLSNWCWAAVTAAIQELYGETYATSQCGVATNCLHQPCCPPGPNTEINPLNVAYNILTSLGPNAVVPAAGTLGFDVIQGEISGGRPVCCIVQWDRGGDHVLLIAGFTPQGDVWIDDPASPGLHALPYLAFSQSYGVDGHWQASVLTRHSGP